MHTAILFGILVAALASNVRDEASARPWIALSAADAEREAFLLEATIVETKSSPGGVTGSSRVTLRREGIVHDAHVQLIDEYRPVAQLGRRREIDFRDSWRNNVAAYRLDRLLGLGMVPVAVVRHLSFRKGAFSWWVDDVIMDERTRVREKRPPPDTAAWNQRMLTVRLFDQLIFNTDRNPGNLLIDKDWRLWMIDHSRAFKIHKELKDEKSLDAHCEKDLLAALRRLERTSLKSAMKDLLSDGQIRALLARRDRIVRFYDEKITALGEDAVLYDLPKQR